MRRHVDRCFAVQSERQQLALTKKARGYLDGYVSLSVQAKSFSDEAYHEMLAWKGAVHEEQRSLRAVQRRPELAATFVELRSVTARLAKLSAATPDPKQVDVWRRQVSDLELDRERLEKDLTSRSAEYREGQQPVTLEDLQRILPKGAVVVDFLEFDHLLPGEQGAKPRYELHLAAFVVRAEGPVKLLDLGAVEPLEKAVEQWRESFGVTPAAVAAGKLLRERLWDPLDLHPDELVLVAPDGVAAKMPLVALPGKAEGKYLLEEQRVVVFPVPRALPALLAEKAAPQAPGNLLALGGVDYDSMEAVTVEPAPSLAFGRKRGVRGAADEPYLRLEGTAQEVTMIEAMYGKKWKTGLTVLTGSGASEAAVRREAPRHLYLHFATHGHFKSQPATAAGAPRASHLEDEGRAFVGVSPGLLTAVVLAGANKPDPKGDDGLLTADEVSTLDLTAVELAVLSACETGLGKSAGGEGMLGLQRAFQVAGARSTVSSLWKVDDKATRLLMERFYENLWGTNGKEPLGTLEALREAQLWMLKEGVGRGAARVTEGEPKAARTPPYYWAPFVLSGDWR